MKMKPFIRGKDNLPGADISWVNGKYQVLVQYLPEWTMLSIRREDRRPILDWRDLQWIKNELVGPEREAVQLFPAESRLVDTSNQYYLFVAPEGYRFPFGFTARLVSEAFQLTQGTETSRQRPFAEHVRPSDLNEGEQKLKAEFESLKARLEVTGVRT